MSIKIISRKSGFRRAGIAHPPVAVYPDDHFTQGQIDQLEAEPLLTVIRIADDAAPRPLLIKEAIELFAGEIEKRTDDEIRDALDRAELARSEEEPPQSNGEAASDKPASGEAVKKADAKGKATAKPAANK